jgi:hypothetical protein
LDVRIIQCIFFFHNLFLLILTKNSLFLT